MNYEKYLWKVKAMTVKVAARLLGKSEQFVRIGLQREILPFGYAVQILRVSWKGRLNMAKFKVGDIIVGNDKADINYGVTKKGVKCKVICVCDDDFIKVEVMCGVFKGREHYVRYECFDLVQCDEITITRYGNTVVAKYGKKVGVAKCSPEDEFDFETGAKLAFERLFEKPTFTKDDLKTGMFVMTNTGKLGVVVNDSILYQEGGFDWVSQLNNELDALLNKQDG